MSGQVDRSSGRSGENWDGRGHGFNRPMTDTVSDTPDGVRAVPRSVMVSDSGGTETFVRTVADFTAGKPQPVSLVCVLREVEAALWQWSWQKTIDWEPERVQIATLTDRDETASTEQASSQQLDGITNEVVMEPDLARLGLFIQHAISDWEDEMDGEGALVVCLDAVEPLLETYTAEQVFEFLFLVEERTKLAGADFLVGIDPHAVDVNTYLLLKPVVDVVVGTQKATLSSRP